MHYFVCNKINENIFILFYIQKKIIKIKIINIDNIIKIVTQKFLHLFLLIYFLYLYYISKVKGT